MFFFRVLSIMFLFSCSLLTLEGSIFQEEVVFIYDGPGVSREGIKQLELAVKAVLPSCQLETITPDQVIEEPWEERAAFFILPGGADIPYAKALNGLGNQKIRRYVEGGGTFLGLCAGGYYGSSFVDFAKGASIEVQQERELSFFPGIARGPVLAEYDYFSSSGVRAAELSWATSTGFIKGEQFTVFFNGGCYFVEADLFPNTSILAYYDQGGEWPAIIECQVGEGTAILSGVHFEYDPRLLDSSDPYIKELIPRMLEGDHQRKRLLEYLLVKATRKVPYG